MGNTNFKVYRSDEFININIEKVPENRALTCMVKYSLNLDTLSRCLPRPSRLQFFLSLALYKLYCKQSKTGGGEGLGMRLPHFGRGSELRLSNLMNLKCLI